MGENDGTKELLQALQESQIDWDWILDEVKSCRLELEEVLTWMKVPMKETREYYKYLGLVSFGGGMSGIILDPQIISRHDRGDLGFWKLLINGNLSDPKIDLILSETTNSKVPKFTDNQLIYLMEDWISKIYITDLRGYQNRGEFLDTVDKFLEYSSSLEFRLVVLKNLKSMTNKFGLGVGGNSRSQFANIILKHFAKELEFVGILEFIKALQIGRAHV